MRTTLDIDNDVLAAAKELGHRERTSAGQVISRLARMALTARAGQRRPGSAVGGFRPLPSRGAVVGNDTVNALREAEGV